VLELITFAVSFIARAIQQHIFNNQEIRKKELDLLARKNELVAEGQRQIREKYDSGLLGITASVLAILAFTSIIVLPKVVSVFFPEVAVNFAYLDISKGFLFFTSDVTKMYFKTMSGLVITPMDTNLVAAIAGLYFGSLRTSMRRY
jgi:hypothetical protein